MPFKEKAIVRHRLRPDWGAGRLLQRTEEYLQIDFSAGGLKKLKTVIADEHLEAASDEEARALKPPKPPKAVAPKAAAPKAAALKATPVQKAAAVQKPTATQKTKDVAKKAVKPKSRKS